jgi:tetratricopeptide (TPR) repeat protein
MTNHYETLGVSRSATLEEVKKARNQCVRRFPPEIDPEQFKRIEEAYGVLKEPKSRSNYDVRLDHGPELDRLEVLTKELMEKEDWAGAARAFKQIVVLNPSADGDRNMLGICLTRIENWAEAKKAYERLVREVDHSSVYWFNYATVFTNEAIELEIDSPVRASLLAESRRLLEKARDLNPTDSDIHHAISRTFSLARNYSKAIEWIEKAIEVEGQPPVAQSYYLLAQMTNLSGNRDGVMVVADRLVRALPNNPEARSDAARKFASWAVELYEDHLFNAALLYLRAAGRIAPHDEPITKVLARWSQAQDASDQYDLLANDPVVIPPMRLWLAILSDEARNLELNQPRAQFFDQINEALETYDDRQIVASARQVRVKYPALYQLDSEELDKFERPRDPPSGRSVNASRTSASCF